MIVENPIADEETVGLAVDSRQLGRKSFGAAIWTCRAQWRHFGLRRFGSAAENLRARGMITLHRIRLFARDLEQAQCRHPDLFAGRFRNLEAKPDVALSSEVINFRRPDFRENPTQGRPIRQIAVMKEERLVVDGAVAAQMLDARTEQVTGAPDHAMDRVSLIEEKLC